MPRPKAERYECWLQVDIDGGVTRRYWSHTGKEAREISQQAFSIARRSGAVCGIVIVAPPEVPVLREGEEKQVAISKVVVATSPAVPDPLAVSDQVRDWLAAQWDLPDAMTTPPDYFDRWRAVRNRVTAILRPVMWPVFADEGQVLPEVVANCLYGGSRALVETLVAQSMSRHDAWPTLLALATQGAKPLDKISERLQTLASADSYDLREAGMVEDDIVRGARTGDDFYEAMWRWRKRDRYEVEEEPRWRAFGDLAEEIHHVREFLADRLEPEIRIRLMSDLGAEADRLAAQARIEASRRRSPLMVAASWFRPRSRKRLPGNTEYMRLVAYAVAIRLVPEQ